MNKENLLKMAGYLEGDPGYFSMRELSHCVLGHASRQFNDKKVTCASHREIMKDVFGVEPDSDAATFLFAGQWGWKEGGFDPKAAADRLRYVAVHGDAPSRDQWERFEKKFVPTPKFKSLNVNINELAVAWR